MDCRGVVLCLVAVSMMLLLTQVEARNKKVVIHVPYKVKKIKHVHTIYKTIHHHHTHHELEPVHLEPAHLTSASDEHEHFHHMHIHEDAPPGQHSQPVPGISIPEFLPDVPLELPIDIPDVPRDPFTVKPQKKLPKKTRNLIPLYRRAL